MSKLLATLIVALGVAGTAQAMTTLHHHHDHGDGPGATAAPEIDPGEALSALTMLAGGLAVVRGRRNKK